VIMDQIENSRLKKLIVIYIVATLAIAWVLEYLFAFHGKTFSFELWIFFFFPLMMVPATVALIFTAIIPDFKFRDFGFGVGGWNNWLLGIAYPCVMVAGVIILARILGFATFEPKDADPAVTLWAGLQGYPLLLLNALPGHLGEELGWRGFLLNKTLRFGKIKAAALSSAVWALFHLVIAFKPPAGSLGWIWSVSFLLNVFFAGFVFAWIYQRSGSIWPVYLAHVTWNFINPLLLGNVYSDTPSRFFDGSVQIVNGEGLLGCAVNMVLAVIIIRAWRREGSGLSG